MRMPASWFPLSVSLWEIPPDGKQILYIYIKKNVEQNQQKKRSLTISRAKIDENLVRFAVRRRALVECFHAFPERDAKFEHLIALICIWKKGETKLHVN